MEQDGRGGLISRGFYWRTHELWASCCPRCIHPVFRARKAAVGVGIISLAFFSYLEGSRKRYSPCWIRAVRKPCRGRFCVTAFAGLSELCRALTGDLDVIPLHHLLYDGQPMICRPYALPWCLNSKWNHRFSHSMVAQRYQGRICHGTVGAKMSYATFTTY